MTTLAAELHYEAAHPVRVNIEPATVNRNRLTTAFRLVLAIPHLILVGGPMAATLYWSWTSSEGLTYQWGAGGGALGLMAVAVLSVAWAFTTVIAWFAILFTGRYPVQLYDFGAGVLRWNTRVEAYLLLLRDEYPPFSLADAGADTAAPSSTT